MTRGRGFRINLTGAKYADHWLWDRRDRRKSGPPYAMGRIKPPVATSHPPPSICLLLDVTNMDGTQAPTVIYLASSGGRSGSRITPEVGFFARVSPDR